MTISGRIAAIALSAAGIIALAGACVTHAPPATAQTPAPKAMAFDADGKLITPRGTERWITLGVTLALTYEGDPGTGFNTVRIDPASFDDYIATGKFPVGTVMELEVRARDENASPARSGSYQGALRGRSLHVKDEKAGPGTWTFWSMDVSKPTQTPIPRAANCYSCHDQHAKEDTVFTQFYPILKERRPS